MRCGCKPYNPLSDRYMFKDAAGSYQTENTSTLFPSSV